MSKTRTYSLVERLRRDLASAEGQVKRAQQKYDELREEYRGADKNRRGALIRHGDQARLELDDAERRLKFVKVSLAAEEKRLQEPGAFLRFE